MKNFSPSTNHGDAIMFHSDFRDWQIECIESAIQKFQVPHSHFMCLATPGAGKTFMAATLGKHLLDNGIIDYIVVFSPSTTVANDFKETLEGTIGRKFEGKLSHAGLSVTYQSMVYQQPWFWELFEHSRVFVIFDEIHHCAGDSIQNANAWGEKIISFIQGKAQYSLALSGTPWRSNNTPISLAAYCTESGQLFVDYQYGLYSAIKDNVCRRPHITAVDNKKVSVRDEHSVNHFGSFKELLLSSECQYSDVIYHHEIITALLKRAISRLDKLRCANPVAAGLIVAASIDHARTIQLLLRELGKSAIVVTSKDTDAQQRISDFKCSQDQWIIAVGMISEGTNIPRLSVCCYLSLVTTELYFRQVLGRILRRQSKIDETGYLIMPAHPTLIKYATRVYDEVPKEQNLLFDIVEDNVNTNDIFSTTKVQIEKGIERSKMIFDIAGESMHLQKQHGCLEHWYNTHIDALGQYKTQIIAL